MSTRFHAHRAIPKGPGLCQIEGEARMNIDLSTAQRILAAAIEEATKQGLSVCVAVLDAGGNLNAFARMDGSWLGSIDVAYRKARTSVLFQMNTEAVWEACKPGAPAQGLQLTNHGLVTFAGGLPLRWAGGELAGAIGVSGGQVSQDAEVSRAGARAFHTTEEGNHE